MPIVDQSPFNELDFALLRLEKSIKDKDAQGLTKVDFAEMAPGVRDTLNMLQHPGGQFMQLALSGNGVTWVSDDGDRLQYVTRSAKGSSGSPCFNDKWELVALHSREITRRMGPFGVGSIRQGVVFKKIYERIKDHLPPPPA
jgi:V8-like Glu-specific endopeptidase